MALRSYNPWTRERIKALRNSHNLSQAALAALLGVSVTTVARWEGNKNPHHPDRRAEKALDLIESGTSKWIVDGKCAWCGTEHANQGDIDLCKEIIDALKNERIRSLAERERLQQTGEWDKLLSDAKGIAVEEEWHLASTIHSLSARTGLSNMLSAEIVGQVFKDSAAIKN